MSALLAGCLLIAIDGDTVRCGAERIRLLGIDAPEMHGRCRPGRICAPGDPLASKRALAGLLKGRVRIERHGTDRYGRTLAWLSVGGRDLSCRQVTGGMARYERRWDRGGYLMRTCRAVSRAA